jgi:predicted transcriptional regulator
MQVRGLESNLKRSVQDVFQKARINKASKIYEHGISMGATAELLGISLWDLSSYVGQSTISDMKEGKTVDVRTRVKNVMEFFSG